MKAKPWNLVADIGGTNARFAIADYKSATLRAVKHYPVSEHPEFADALKHFLSDIGALGDWRAAPGAACLAMAGAIDGDRLNLTNSPWVIDRVEISELLGGARVELINDFAAIGYAIPHLDSGDWRQIGGGVPDAERAIGVIGPGTGLGICTVVPTGTGYRILEGEGGHVDFAPNGADEIAVLKIMGERFGHVSTERLLSGTGILNIYRALAELAENPVVFSSPQAVTDAALSGEDGLAKKTLAMFCGVLGSTAGNLCLTLGARGGIYIAGGIVPRFTDFLAQSDFRSRFEDKGRFQSYLAPVPVRVIVRQDVGLYGAMKQLEISE